MERDNKGRSATQTQTKPERTNYREFLRVVSRVIEEHPEEVAVVEAQIRRYRATSATATDLTATSNQHQEILFALMQSKEGQAAAQTLDEAYRKLGGPTGGGGGVETQILPVIMAWVIIDIIIWGCVALKCV